MNATIAAMLETSAGRTLLDSALTTLETTPVSRSPRIVAIATRRVLSHAWAPARLARLREGHDRLDPIDVVTYHLGRERFYGLNDGNHRTELARERSQERIRAEVGGGWICDPRRFILEPSGALWYLESERTAKLRRHLRADDPLLRLLPALGVRQAALR